MTAFLVLMALTMITVAALYFLWSIGYIGWLLIQKRSLHGKLLEANQRVTFTEVNLRAANAECNDLRIKLGVQAAVNTIRAIPAAYVSGNTGPRN